MTFLLESLIKSEWTDEHHAEPRGDGRMKNWKVPPQLARTCGVSEKIIIDLAATGRISSRRLPGARLEIFVPELLAVIQASTRLGSLGILAAQTEKSS
jgi:hypothetical protein